MRRSGANQKAGAVRAMRRAGGVRGWSRLRRGPCRRLRDRRHRASPPRRPSRAMSASSTKDGYTRIIVKLAEEVESTVKVAGGIVVVQFKRPVDVGDRESVDAPRPNMSAPRAAIRTAPAFASRSSRKVTVNSMAAGERLFIDLSAGELDRRRARIAAGCDRGSRQARARSREASAPAARRSTRRASGRCGCGSRASRPSRAMSSK